MSDDQTAPGRLPDVWASRDYPVLREVTRRLDEGARDMDVDEVADALGMPQEQVGRAAAALERRGFVRTRGAGNAPWPLSFVDVAGSAYLVTGLHPDGDDALSQLVAALRQAADQEPNEEERGRLRQAADGLLGVSRNVMQGVLTAYLTGQIT